MYTACLKTNYLINCQKFRTLIKRIICIALLLSATLATAQENGELNGLFRTRYMRTDNRNSLSDFSILVSYGYLKYQYKAKDWLSFGVQGNGLLNFGTDQITKRDGITGAGPIYEGNLWNQNLMSGSSEFALPQLYAKLDFDKHVVTIGRFLKDTPIINAEVWPFPIALQGIWYEFDPNDRLKLQFGGINRVAPRFSGRFDGIGESLGQVGTGVGVDGNPSGYPGNVVSDFIAIVNMNWKVSEKVKLDIWNYLADNISNTIFLEPSFKLADGLNLKTMLILQSRVGNGGNSNPTLSYVFESNAEYYGVRLEKESGSNLFQFNFSRISDNGRLLLPREWGKEPFYTFQRRTRVEGFRDVTSLMVKWQRKWANEKSDMRFFSSFSWNKMPDANDALRSKLRVPSNFHWDASFKYEPKTSPLDGFSAEILGAYRFLNDDINGNESIRINKADFAHLDIILSYTF